MHACIYACMHVNMHACTRLRMLACMYVFLSISVMFHLVLKCWFFNWKQCWYENNKIPNPHICVKIRITYGAIIHSYPVSGLLKFHIDITPHCNPITIQCHCALFMIIIFVSLKCSFSFRSTQQLLQLPPSTHLYGVVIRTFPQKTTMHSSEKINTSVWTSVWISGAENRMNSWTHEPHRLLKLNKKKISAVFNGTFIQHIVT